METAEVSGGYIMSDVERWKAKELIFKSAFEHLCSHVKIDPTWTVAEFGVGKWGFARFYKAQFNCVFGIDIENYSKYHPGVEFFLSDGQTTTIKNESVDLTASHSVLEHAMDLDAAISEIDRITKPGGYIFLTVSPLYYSAFGAHLYRDGKRLDNWEHLDPASELYLTRDPVPDARTAGHYLNMLTSSMFLAAIGRVSWNIISYNIRFEDKPLPAYVDRTVASELDLMIRDFRFIGRKVKIPVEN